MTDERTSAEILADLAAVAAELLRADETTAELRARRVALYREARALPSPPSYAVLGEATGVTEVAVMRTLRRASVGASEDDRT